MSKQYFRGSLLWCVNVTGAPIGGFGVSVAIILGDFLRGDINAGLMLVLVLAVAAGLLAYFPGNLSLMWPYVVEIEPKTGITLVGPLKKLNIPISNVAVIDDSLFWQGQVVILRRPCRLLGQFIIPWYFGDQRHDLIRAIKVAIESESIE